MNTIGTVTVIEGDLADAGRLDDFGEATATIVGGPHNGHTIRISTAKHNCGAFYEDVACSCGATYSWGHGGCHRHPSALDEGDPELAKVLTLAYVWDRDR